MFVKCLIGTLITLAIEFSSGMIFNVWLGMNLWSYKGVFGNVYGQICLPYAIGWFFLIPLALFINDRLRHLLFKEKEPRISLLDYYKKLITGK